MEDYSGNGFTATLVGGEAAFGDGHVAIPRRASFHQMRSGYPLQDMFNIARVTHAGGGEAARSDIVSRAAYGPREISIAAPYLNANQAGDRGDWAINQRKDPHSRPAMHIMNSSAENLRAMLSRQISDRVTVSDYHGDSGLEDDYYIERVGWAVDRSALVASAIWQLSPASALDYLILDHADYGKLDTGKLAF